MLERRNVLEQQGVAEQGVVAKRGDAAERGDVAEHEEAERLCLLVYAGTASHSVCGHLQ